MDSITEMLSIKTKKWKENIKNILIKPMICGVCMCEDADLAHWDTLFYIADEKKERILKDILSATFGIHIKALLPTKLLCNGCVTTIIQAYCLIRKIKTNYSVLQKYESLISQQIKCSMELDTPKEKELLITIDNIDSLNVPTTITQPKVSVTQIFLCDINNLAETEQNFNFEDAVMKYECPYCGHQFPNYMQFKKHYSLHKDIYYRCKQCLKRFKLFKDLVNHRKNVHKELSLYICDTCEIILLNSESIEHVNDHNVKKTCQICNIMFETKSALDDHKTKLHPKSLLPYLCEECGNNFSSQSFLDAHRLTHKTPTANKQIKEIIIDEERINVERVTNNLHTSYEMKCKSCSQVLSSEEIQIHFSKQSSNKCEVCRKAFCTSEQLNNHIQTKHLKHQTASSNKDENLATNLKETQYYCKECNKTFDCADAYNEHNNMEKHDKQCPICLNKYSWKTFGWHFKKHFTENDSKNNVEIFTCDVCRINFINKTELKKHCKQHSQLKETKKINIVFYNKRLKNHKQEKNALKSCNQCNYTTKFAACLDAHMNRHHLNIRPYKCDQCNKSFYSSYTLSGHKATHYAGRPEYVCDICGKKFLSQKALTYHIRLHTGEKTYPCDMCDMSFITASRRREHVIRKHLDPSVECEYCHKKLYTKRDLRRHIGDCHDGESKIKKNNKNVVEDGNNYALVEEMVVEDPDEYALVEENEEND